MGALLHDRGQCLCAAADGALPARLDAELRAIGFAAPIFLMLSGGGLTTIETALPVSDPAGRKRPGRRRDLLRPCRAAMRDRERAVVRHGRHHGEDLPDRRITQPQTARTFEVARVGRFRKGSGLPLRIPVIEMVEIGAGGGSIAHVDTMGRITVGPESAGADPGPACYGRGGMRPAVTDANLALGRYDPARFAGGTMRLDPQLPRTALAAAVGDQLRLTPELAALGVSRWSTRTWPTPRACTRSNRGKTYEGRTLIAFGGGGPVHACRVAEKIGITRVLVPSGAGVGSAIGFLRAPVGYEVVRSLYQRFSAFDRRGGERAAARDAARGRGGGRSGGLDMKTGESRIAYMRYVGQGHEIPVPLPARPLTAADVPAIRAAYEAEYTRFYDRPVPGSDVEIMSYAVSVATLPAEPETARDGEPVQPGSAAHPERTQRVRDTVSGEVSEWSVYDRAALSEGACAQRSGDHRRGRDLDACRPGLDGHDRRFRVCRTDARGRVMREPDGALAQIQRQIMWNRLIAVVEEQAQTMIRTAFSPRCARPAIFRPASSTCRAA